MVNLRGELEDFLSGVKEAKAMVDVLEDLRIETAVAHLKEVKTIARAKLKTDERDSHKLARLLRMGEIPKVYKQSRENRASQRVLHQRAFYVGKQTSVKNRLGGVCISGKK